MKAALFLLGLILNGSVLSAAAILQYHASGTFGELRPETPYSAPNEAFDFRFTLESEPTPQTVGPNSFGVPATIRLAVGSRPLLVSDVDVVFFDAGSFSGFTVDFSDFSLGFGVMGLFSGPLTSPTMQVGTFQLPEGTLTVTPVPEPATVGSIFAGLIAIIAIRLAPGRQRR